MREVRHKGRSWPQVSWLEHGPRRNPVTYCILLYWLQILTIYKLHLLPNYYYVVSNNSRYPNLNKINRTLQHTVCPKLFETCV